jgi:hypothetical protein
MNAKISGSLPRAAILALLFAFAALLSSQIVAAKPPVVPPAALNTPALSFSNQTQTTIDVTVTAGASGAPFGFTLQWMTQADYLANGFSSTPPLGCDASFAGEANNSRYVLAAGQSITVTVGNFTADNGFSTTCAGPLVCGTVYVFRVFAHGPAGTKSDFSAIVTATTAPCSTGCALSQGYWKTHGPIPVGNNVNAWPPHAPVTLGTVAYTDLQLLAILNQPPLGNGLVSLARQLIAVRLSILNGADGSSIAGAIAAADLLIGGLVVPPVGTDFLDPNITGALTATFDEWISTNECNSTDS